MIERLTNTTKIALPMSNWELQLNERLEKLLKIEGLTFGTIKPSLITTEGGVYLITDSRNELNEIPYYIGRTNNLRRRIYTNHLMGSLTNARLKKYLVNDPIQESILDKNSAKQFIRENCSVRWIVEEDYKYRGYYEGYFTGVLKPQYGVYEEH